MSSVFPTASTVSRPSNEPPRIDLWPVALQSAEKLRGTIVPCGPGMRSVGWPETPRVRLTALAPWLGTDRVATHLTAAWVWGAANTPGKPLQVSTRAGRRGPAANSEWLRVYEMRYAEADTTWFGQLRASTPLRTVTDLLCKPNNISEAEWVVCRLLIGLVDGGVETVMASLTDHRRPHNKLARQRMVNFQ